MALLYLSLRDALLGSIVVLGGEPLLQDLVFGLIVPWDTWLIIGVVVYAFGLLKLSTLWRTHGFADHDFIPCLSKRHRVGIRYVCCQLLSEFLLVVFDSVLVFLEFIGTVVDTRWFFILLTSL